MGINQRVSFTKNMDTTTPLDLLSATMSGEVTPREHPSSVWKAITSALICQAFAVSMFVYYLHVQTSVDTDRPTKIEERSCQWLQVYRDSGLQQDPSCFLMDKLEKPQMPTLHSIFADPVTNNVIAIGIRFWFEQWHEESFFCEFRGADGRVFVRLTDPMLKDFMRVGFTPQYIIVMTCPLPKPLYGVPKFTLTLRRTSNKSLAYEDITVCQSTTGGDRKRYLSMCTMLKNMDNAVPPWLDYHRQLGVEHVFIYDNSDNSTLYQVVQQYVDSGFLTIIPWAHEHSSNKTYLEVQIASENDCLWRYRYRSDWMIKIDVDEYLQPMDPQMPLITDVLRKYSGVMDTIGSLRVQNWYFCHGSDQTTNRTVSLDPHYRGKNVFERLQFRKRKPTAVNMGHDKAAVRPINVHFFKIHDVKLGGDTITLSPHTEMRMVHYRADNPRHPDFQCHDRRPVSDGSMCRLWAKIKGLSPNGSEPNGINCIESGQLKKIADRRMKGSGQTITSNVAQRSRSKNL